MSETKGSIPPYRTSDSAPFVYFDAALCFGTMAGAVQIELVSRVLTPDADTGHTTAGFVETGHLRCSPTAAASLRSALDQALKMLEQPPDAATSGTATLN